MALPQINQAQYRSLLDIVMLSGHPLLVVGEPGIGKTRTPKHYCKEKGIKLIVSHPATDAPQDIKGYPAKSTMEIDPPPRRSSLGDLSDLMDLLDAANDEVKQKQIMDIAVFLPFGQMLEILTATEDTIWFFDDFGQAADSVQKALMQLIGDRELCGKSIPDCVRIIAATNGKEHKAGVQGLLEPIKSRFGMIVQLVADLPGFRLYGTQNKYYRSILTFLEYSPNALCEFHTDKGMENSPNPRLWEKLSDQLYAFDKSIGYELDNPLREIMCSGAIGSSWGKQYAAFERLEAKLDDYEDIVSDPENWPINQSLDVKIAMLSMLANKGRPSDHEALFQYTGKMKKEYQTVFFRFVRRYNKALLETDSAQRWWAQNLHIYMD